MEFTILYERQIFCFVDLNDTYCSSIKKIVEEIAEIIIRLEVTVEKIKMVDIAQTEEKK